MSFADRLRDLRTRLPPTTTLVVLLLAMAGSMVHQLGPIFKWDGGVPYVHKLNLWEWYIEDAAITFSYSRNWFNGDGLSPFPGGERIEGYSNPSWMALMALWMFVGVDPWLSSKLMALAFGAATVWITWLIAREVVDDPDSPAVLIAPVFLAAFPQFAFWNASGLENPIFNLFLALGLWRTLVEARLGGFPWSSVAFLGLALTRPEGIMYAAWGGFVYLVFQSTAGRGLGSTAKWLAAFFVPFTIYHLLRYNYFAWAFPNTYYAKLGDKEFKPFAWSSRGWKYIRGWASGTFDETGKEGIGIGWFLPVYYAGLLGLRGNRGWVVPLLGVVTAGLFLYPSSDLTNTWEFWPKDLPEPDWWKEGRVWALFALTLILPVMRLGDPRSGGRVLLWGMGFLSLFFCIASGGDWMKGHRWMSFLSIPAAVLFAVGVDEIAAFAQRTFDASGSRRWGLPAWVAAPLLTLAVLPNFYFNSEWFFGKRETGPFSVQHRVNYSASIQRRLFEEDNQWFNLDVDMGAHTWWSDHVMVDMAGLIDVTVAHHSFAHRAVTKEYLFEELRPQFAHVHGGWANSSRIPTFNEWKQQYVSIPGFPTSPGSKTNHMGNHVRRDLLLQTQWKGPPVRRVELNHDVVLAGFRVPSPEVSKGKAMYLEVGLQYGAIEEREDLRLMAFLSNADGHVQTFELPLGYDWIGSSEWRPEEVFVGKFAVNLRQDLEPGSYDLGFVVLRADGSIVQPLEPTPPAETGPVFGGYGTPPRFATGEVRFRDIVQIGEPGSGEKAARDDFEKALELARTGSCQDAEAAWWQARCHLPRANNWQDQHRADLGPVLAGCWVEAAKVAEADHDAALHLARARFWDRDVTALAEVADEVGGRLYDAGVVARDAADWETAYRAFSDAVTANPSLAWARRYAEEARDYRLKVDPETLEKAKADRAARPAPEPRPAKPAKPAEGKPEDEAKGDEAKGDNPKGDAPKEEGAEAPAKAARPPRPPKPVAEPRPAEEAAP